MQEGLKKGISWVCPRALPGQRNQRQNQGGTWDVAVGSYKRSGFIFFPLPSSFFFFSYCHFHLGLFFKTNTRTHRGWSCSLLGFHFKCNLVLKSIFPFGLEKTTIVSLVTCSPIIPEQMPSKKFCSYCRKTADKMLHNHHYCKNCGKSG